MRKTVNLPLYDEFMEIFANHEIKNWQAKDFWREMKICEISSKKPKSRMYAGLRILLKYRYLEVNQNHAAKRAFDYKETPRLNELRDKYKKDKLARIFIRKKIEFLSEINEKENNIDFIKKLLTDDKTLEKYFITHQQKLENEIRNINSNIKFMEEVLN